MKNSDEAMAAHVEEFYGFLAWATYQAARAGADPDMEPWLALPEEERRNWCSAALAVVAFYARVLADPAEIQSIIDSALKARLEMS